MGRQNLEAGARRQKRQKSLTGVSLRDLSWRSRRSPTLVEPSDLTVIRFFIGSLAEATGEGLRPESASVPISGTRKPRRPRHRLETLGVRSWLSANGVRAMRWPAQEERPPLVGAVDQHTAAAKHQNQKKLANRKFFKARPSRYRVETHLIHITMNAQFLIISLLKLQAPVLQRRDLKPAHKRKHKSR